MLRIRKEQMEALRAVMARRFEERMVRHVAQVHPPRYDDLGETGVRELVGQGVERAAGYGIQAEIDVARFIDLMFRIAPEFERLADMAWARAILEEGSISGHAKVELVYQQLAARPEQDQP